MVLKDKVIQLRKERHFTRQALHQRIVEIVGKDAISYKTLQRIESGRFDGRVTSLYQLCLGLNVPLKDFLEEITRYNIKEYNRWDDHEEVYKYNEGAQAEIISGPKMPFLSLKLTLLPKAKTTPEQDPKEIGDFLKWIYVLKGKVFCVVDGKQSLLEPGGCASFDSTLPHYFENAGITKAQCLIIQHPRHL